MKEEFHLIDQLEIDQFLSRDEWIFLIEHRSDALERYLFEKSEAVRIREYGHDIYIRGLIEFTNYCHNDCYYCGIRKSNPNILRYRLSPSEILSCCHIGYELGFRTFVLQGGEDNWFTTKRMAEIVAEIHSHFPDCAITLSIGERSRESYQALFDAGADRYLLRHETYDPVHYRRLHPDSLSAVHRRKCLWDLKEIGYQIPPRTPFVGKNFNVTRAGIHADGLLKNEEIYNIFDTEKFLNRPVLCAISNTSGLAGIAHWLNTYYKLKGDKQVQKNSELVADI